jgi:hypothetical protein
VDIKLENNQIALLAKMNDDGTADFEVLDNFENGLEDDTATTMYTIMFGFIGAQMMDPELVQSFGQSMIDWWNERGEDFNELLDNPISANSNPSPKLEVIQGGKTDDTDG